jgi:hypothetical protein
MSRRPRARVVGQRQDVGASDDAGAGEERERRVRIVRIRWVEWSCPGLVEGELLSKLHVPHRTASEGDTEIAPPWAIVDPDATERLLGGWVLS